MSYILEALKKSESERQQASASPSIYSPDPQLGHQEHRGSRFIVWGLVAIIFFIAMGGGIYLLSGKKIISITVTVPESETAGIDSSHSSQGQANEATDIVRLEPTGKKRVFAAMPETANDFLQPEPLTSPSSAETPGETEYQPTVPNLEDLAPAFRNSIPTLQLAGHVYSEDAALRMIIVNNQVVREKATIAQDYLLEEITPAGIILSKGDIRFHVDAQ